MAEDEECRCHSSRITRRFFGDNVGGQRTFEAGRWRRPDAFHKSGRFAGASAILTGRGLPFRHTPSAALGESLADHCSGPAVVELFSPIKKVRA